MEVECHKLDSTLVLQGSTDSGPSYDKYAEALHKQTELKDKQHTLKSGVQLMEQLLTHILTTGGVSSATNPLFLQLVSEIQRVNGEIQQIVSEAGRSN